MPGMPAVCRGPGVRRGGPKRLFSRLCVNPSAGGGPAIHVLGAASKAWLPATGAGMTAERVFLRLILRSRAKRGVSKDGRPIGAASCFETRIAARYAPQHEAERGVRMSCEADGPGWQQRINAALRKAAGKVGPLTAIVGRFS